MKPTAAIRLPMGVLCTLLLAAQVLGLHYHRHVHAAGHDGYAAAHTHHAHASLGHAGALHAHGHDADYDAHDAGGESPRHGHTVSNLEIDIAVPDGIGKVFKSATLLGMPVSLLPWAPAPAAVPRFLRPPAAVPVRPRWYAIGPPSQAPPAIPLRFA